MRTIGIGLLFVSLMSGQDPPDLAMLMEPSLGRQRASVRKQARAPESQPAFFILPPTQMPGEEPAGGPAAPADSPVARAPDCSPLTGAQLEPLIGEAARAHGLQPEWLRHIVQQKSGGEPCAVSPDGAVGLMQLMPATIRQFGVSIPADPRQNLMAGAGVLKQLLDRYYGDFSRAVGDYIAGESDVDDPPGLGGAGTGTSHSAPASGYPAKSRPKVADKKK